MDWPAVLNEPIGLTVAFLHLTKLSISDLRLLLNVIYM